MAKKKVADVVVDVLVEAGVGRIYGVAGDSLNGITDVSVNRFAGFVCDMVTVAFRELGEGDVWRCSAGEPEPAAQLSCDVRRGRPPEQQTELAQALIDACVETLGLRSDRLMVEFTQHTGDEMYRQGRGWAAEWTPAEATGSTERRNSAP